MKDKTFIKLTNYFPFLRKRLQLVGMGGKEFRFLGNNLNYLLQELLIGDEECGFNVFVASYYPREFLVNEWKYLFILEKHGILVRATNNDLSGKWEYLKSEIYDYKKIDFKIMVNDMQHCLEKMPTVFDANGINRHNFEGFKQFEVTGVPDEKDYWKIPTGTKFEAIKMEQDFYIGDESRPTFGKAGDWLAIYNWNPIKYTEEEKNAMGWKEIE